MVRENYSKENDSNNTVTLLAQRREVLAKQFEAEAEVATARAELARVEAELLKAGFRATVEFADVW